MPEWCQELEEDLQAGDSVPFILHGQVCGYVRVNRGSRPGRSFWGDWLAEERQVVFYNLSLGQEFGDSQGENLFRQALAPLRTAEDEREADVSRVARRAPIGSVLR